MSPQGTELTGEALTEYLLRREIARRGATQGTGGSLTALETVMAEISAEVTAEAVERQLRENARK